jgi:hypothetical protein
MGEDATYHGNGDGDTLPVEKSGKLLFAPTGILSAKL